MTPYAYVSLPTSEPPTVRLTKREGEVLNLVIEG